MKPLLSIITPVFNNRTYMEACLKNVCSERVDGVEHIIVDGGSDDGTVEVIKAYSGRYGHIRWVSGKDAGQSDAMNKGIRMAMAETIGFLNVDDYYEPGALKRVTDLIGKQSHPFFILGHCHIWDNDGKLIKTHKAHNLSLTRILGKRDFPPNPSAYFYSKQLHDEVGYYNIKDHMSMDVDFLLKMANKGVRTVCVDDVLGNFRLLQGTKTYEGMLSESIYKATNALIDSYWNRLSGPDKFKVRLNRLRLKFKRGLNYLFRPGKFIKRLRS